MEGAAIAQAAYLGKTPFLIVRVISDKADDSTTVDYPEFEKKAIEHSTRLTKEIIRNL
jgi:adenosylhomocysteine nucleosidase